MAATIGLRLAIDVRIRRRLATRCCSLVVEATRLRQHSPRAQSHAMLMHSAPWEKGESS